jgi:hypothetical protein
MKKVILLIVAVAMFIAMPLSSVFAVEVFKAPTEVIQYDADKAYNGYTLFSPFNSPIGTWTTYLMDMKGNIVHTWEGFEYSPGLHGYLLENGNLLRGARIPAAAAANTYGVLSGPPCGGIQEFDWDGNLVWSVDHYSADSISHHDFHRIWNKKLGAYTTIFLTFERMTAADAIDLGTDPIYEGDYTGANENKDGWSLDGIYEVDVSGNIIWKWTFAEHLCQDYDPNKTTTYVADISAHPEKLDINWHTPYGGPNPDWTHCNSLDYNEELDHIVVNAKHMSEFYVIDHGGTFVVGEAVPGTQAATDAGDFLYRFGNPSVYDSGDPPAYHDEGHHQMYASHDIQWIDPVHYTGGPALPGAGNFLIFDNGTWCPIFAHSEIVEINPYILDAAGNTSSNYVDPPDAGYTSQKGVGGVGAVGFELSNQVPWRFQSQVGTSFYSSYISGCQRLPNGNTVIMSGATGHMFEVTEDKEVVWEYINPVTKAGIRTTQTDADGGRVFSTFRCHRYGPDYPAFAGKDLTPKGTITGLPEFGGVPVESVPITGWGIPPGTTSEAGAGAGAGGEGGGGGY